MCTYLDVKESRVDLCDLDRMNEMILMRRVNENRARAAAERTQERIGKPADLPLVGDLGQFPGNGVAQSPMSMFDARRR